MLLSSWIGEIDVLKHISTFELISIELHGSFLINLDLWYMINCIVCQFTSNLSFSNSFGVRGHSTKGGSSENGTEHDGNDDTS